MEATQNQTDLTYYVQSMISKLEHKIAEKQSEIKWADREIALLKQLLSLINPRPCPNCKGLGNIQVWYDQDDSKIETCSACSGSGTKSSIIPNVVQ